MAKNYYLILGITSDATQDEIKSAYREKAKRWHPDHSGEGSEPFLAIREAYEVLCEPGRRRAYDEEKAREERQAQATTRAPRSERLRRGRPPVEPLVPGGRASSRGGPLGPSPLASLLAEFFGHPWSGLGAPVQPGTGRALQEISVEVSLTQEQARRGGCVRVWIPVLHWCPACQGRGGAGVFACPHCLGSGTVVGEGPVDITYPCGVVDGFEGKASLARPGMRDLVLILHFRVDEQV